MIRTVLPWTALLLAILVPVAVAAGSPFLQYREPVYIAAGFAGIVALALLLVQPVLAGRYLPGLDAIAARRWHRWTGTALVLLVAAHVGLLWIVSPPDVVDALTFTSPTPFSIWGVLAMWATVAAALAVAFRCRVRPRTWKAVHVTLASFVATGTVLHALLIEGAMGTVSKAVLCALVALATAKIVFDTKRRRRPT